MKERIRLSREERKVQICHVARKLFIEQGFENTTMKDLMKESGMSIGGLYHYYENIYDVLQDVIRHGGNEKNRIFLELRAQYPEMSMEEILVEAALTMLFDSSEYSVLYVLLLMGMKKNKGLRELYEERKIKAKKEFLTLLKELDMEDLQCLSQDDFIDFFNYTKVGNYYLENETSLENKKEIYRDFINEYIRNNR